MKNFAKRGLALVLAVVLCIGLVAGALTVALAVEIDYATGDASSQYTNVIKNWGKRGETATYLSGNAEAFYAENNTTYAQLSQLAGSADVDAVPGSALYTQLQELMESNHDTITDYEDIKVLCAYTDCQESDSTMLSTFYSGMEVGSAWTTGGTVWNREHVWPDSKGLLNINSGTDEDGDDEHDIMMIRPAYNQYNSGRGNKAYGADTASGYYDPNTISGGAYNLRGDVARIALYVYVRWGNTHFMWGSGGVIQDLDTLLAWMEEDPVDTWELGRNDAVESITGTRNVFVDYPELAFDLFAVETPDDMLTPSGVASDSAYTVTATAADPAQGTVVVTGDTVTAFPAAGYQVKNCTVVSGSATVTQVGTNAFRVDAAADTQVQVTFEAVSYVTLQFKQQDATVKTENVDLADNVYRMPAHQGAVPTGYSFLGWVTDRLEETTAAPGTVYAEGDTYTATAAETFHALYIRVDTDVTDSYVYAPYSGALVEGDYLLTYNGGAMKAVVSSNRLSYQDVTTVGDYILDADAALVWHIAPQDTYYTIYNAGAGKYAGGKSTKNQAALLTSITDYAKWTVASDENTTAYEFVNVGRGNASSSPNNKYLRKNDTYGFACYAKTTGGDLTLYAKTPGQALYSTTAPIIGLSDLGFGAASLVLEENFTINFKADATLFTQKGFEAPYAVFTVGSGSVTVTDYTVKDGKYVFPFTNIAPNRLGETVTATLYASYDGRVYTGKTIEYSVAQYCYNKLGENIGAELQTLLVDLLNYGAAAQNYTGRNTNALVNKDLTDAQKSWGTSGTPALSSVTKTDYATVASPTVTWKGARLVLDDAVTVRVNFAAQSVDGLTVKVETDGGQSWSVPADAAQVENGAYYVYFNGLKAHQMREDLYFTVYSGDIAVSNTLRYSVESYACAKQESTIAYLADLVKAMMRYGDAAYNVAY